MSINDLLKEEDFDMEDYILNVRTDLLIWYGHIKPTRSGIHRSWKHTVDFYRIVRTTYYSPTKQITEVKNLDIIKLFIDGRTIGKVNNLRIIGNSLYSYNTVIVERVLVDNEVNYKVNSKYCSPTTSKQVNMFKRVLNNPDLIV